MRPPAAATGLLGRWRAGGRAAGRAGSCGHGAERRIWSEDRGPLGRCSRCTVAAARRSFGGKSGRGDLFGNCSRAGRGRGQAHLRSPLGVPPPARPCPKAALPVATQPVLPRLLCHRPHSPHSRAARPLRTASGLIPLHAMKEEVHRLSEFCLKRGNCYGILQVGARGHSLPAGRASPSCGTLEAG